MVPSANNKQITELLHLPARRSGARYIPLSVGSIDDQIYVVMKTLKIAGELGVLFSLWQGIGDIDPG